MKIGFIEPGLHVCGGIRRIIETSNRLAEYGHEVTLFTPKGVKSDWLTINAGVRKLKVLPKVPLDVVIYNLADQYKDANTANAKVKVFWVLAPEALYKTPHIPVLALNQGHFMIANSQFTQTYIKKHCKRLAYEPPIVHGGINSDHFKYDVTIPTTHHVLYYGSTRPWKGTHIIETALLGSSLKVLKMEGLNTPQTEMYKLYNSCEMFVSAGQVEGFNFPILEAMKCGCVVICTDDGGNKEFVEHGHNALVVLRNPTAIRNAVVSLVKNKDLRRKLRQNGLQTASQDKFKWEFVTRRFENILLDKVTGK